MAEETKPNKFIGDQSEAEAIMKLNFGGKQTDEESPVEPEPEGYTPSQPKAELPPSRFQAKRKDR